jgi:hypothetical protein
MLIRIDLRINTFAYLQDINYEKKFDNLGLSYQCLKDSGETKLDCSLLTRNHYKTTCNGDPVAYFQSINDEEKSF